MKLPIVSVNKCGDCKACCTVLGVKAIKKQDYKQCEFSCNQGCAVYDTRPSECESYECFWLSNCSDVRLRPDNLGIIIELTQTKIGPAVLIREIVKDAHKSELASNFVASLVEKIDGFIYVVSPDNTRKAFFAPHKQHLAAEISFQYKGF